MVSIGNVVDQVLDTLYRGVRDDTSRRTPSVVYQQIAPIRESLIKERVDRKEKLGSEFYEELLLDISCENGRHYVNVPQFISSSSGPIISSVSSSDGIEEFFPTTKTSWKYTLDTKFGKSKRMYYAEGDRLYLFNPGLASKVLVRAIYSDPLEVGISKDPSGCTPYKDFDFYISENLVDSLFQIYLGRYLPAMTGIPYSPTTDTISENEAR